MSFTTITTAIRSLSEGYETLTYCKGPADKISNSYVVCLAITTVADAIFLAMEVTGRPISTLGRLAIVPLRAYLLQENDSNLSQYTQASQLLSLFVGVSYLAPFPNSLRVGLTLMEMSQRVFFYAEKYAD